MKPSVTFTGEEVCLIAGLLTNSLRQLSGPDYEVADLMLDKALAAFPDRLGGEVMDAVNAARGHR